MERLACLCRRQPYVIEDKVGYELIKPERDWQEWPDMKYTKRLRASIVARARFIEDMAKEQIESGVTQYVLFGPALTALPNEIRRSVRRLIYMKLIIRHIGLERRKTPYKCLQNPRQSSFCSCGRKLRNLIADNMVMLYLHKWNAQEHLGSLSRHR